MVNGVVSLRCPACARPFISLQQQPGTLITCPHCARSSAWETYPLAGEGSHQGVTALPIQRRIAPMRGGIAASVPAPAPPVPSQPRQAAFFMPAAPAWPPAPEQAPMFSPSSPPVFPPAPSASPVWPPASAVPPSPFGVAPSVPASLFHPQASESSQAAGASPVPPPPNPHAFEDLSRSFQEPAVTNGLPEWQPPREERNVPLGIFFVVVLAFAGWMLWANDRSPMAVEFDAPQPPLPQPLVESKTKPSSEVVASPSAADPAPELPQEVRRAELPFTPGTAAAAGEKPDLLVVSQAAEKLLKVLFSAESSEKRVGVIALPEDNRADMDGFFEHNRITLRSIKLADTLPIMIPGQETVPLFQVTTDKNRHGALLRLVSQGKTPLLDWPLFAETHERRLVEYIEKKQDQPAWFHVVLRRSHALELTESVRSQNLCMELQASADDSARCLAVVPEETPLGRFFERELDWGNLYLARLLLQSRKLVDGTHGMVILDCEGAVTGAGLSPGK